MELTPRQQLAVQYWVAQLASDDMDGVLLVLDTIQQQILEDEDLPTKARAAAQAAYELLDSFAGGEDEPIFP